MNEFLTYFLQVNVALAVFYILFRVVFYRDTFWVGRRVYLILAIVISALYPLISLSGWLDGREPIQVFIAEWTPMPMSEFIVFVEPAIETVVANPITWQLIFLIAYVGVSVIFQVRFLVQLFSILLWRIRSRKAFIHNTSVRVIPKDIAPFSFFKTIFLNPDSHNERELEEVLAHENTHVRQWHSVDVLLGELLTIICWANPFAWLLKKEIRQNLEFLADNNVVKSGFNAKKYQYHLTELALYSPNNQITNKFNVSSIKKRITMMNRRESKKRGLIKYALILPVTLALILWSNAEVVSSSVAAVVENFAVEEPMVEQQQQQGTLFNSGQIERAGGTWSIFVDGDEEGVKFLNENARFSTAMIENSNMRSFSVNVIIERDGSVGDVSTWNVPNDDLNAEILRVIRSMPNWRPATRHGETVRSIHRFWLSFREIDGRHGFITTPPAPPPPPAPPRERTEQRTAPPPPPPPPAQRSGTMEIQQNPEFRGGESAKMRFLADNLRYPPSALENGVQGRVVVEFLVNETGEITNARVVESIYPSLDREAVRVINAMPNWVPGEHDGNAVIVRQSLGVVFRISGMPVDFETTDNDIVVVGLAPVSRQSGTMEVTSNEPRRVEDLAGGNHPLIVINDEVKGRMGIDFDFSSISPSDIQSIDILKNSTSIEHFGEEAQDGVISIRTNSSEHVTPQTDVRTGTIVRVYGAISSISSNNGDNPFRPLFVVNGEVMGRLYDTSSFPSPDHIYSVTVLRGEVAIEKYGEEGANGVVVITLRNE